MPSYDFTCRRCGARFEAFLSMSEYSAGEGRECPACGSADAERAYTAVNVMTSSAGSAGGPAARCGGGSGFT